MEKLDLIYAEGFTYADMGYGTIKSNPYKEGSEEWVAWGMGFKACRQSLLSNYYD